MEVNNKTAPVTGQQDQNTISLDLMNRMKLHGMAEAFRESLAGTTPQSMTADTFLSMLLAREWDYRAQAAIARLTKNAAFRYKAYIEQVDYATNRGLDRNQMERLATLDFVHKAQNLFITGSSGTGKSYRAQMVANENGISYIIDDGLLIKENNVIAGTSAKKAPTKIETVKRAIFVNEQEKQEMKKAIKKYKPEAILILGTSDGMVEKIAENLGLQKPAKTIYINEVATETEMQTAKTIRKTEGKHVIPVPTFEIKKDFSGYILDPLQIFKSKGKGNAPYISEKSIIRPTFSYLGNFVISDTVFRQIAEYLAKRTDAINKIIRIRVEKTPEGPTIYMEVIVTYGYNVLVALREFKEKVIKEIEKLTTMNVVDITIVAKGIYMPEEKKDI